MPLLTVRLTDEEHAALKALAADTSMADLIRGWVRDARQPLSITGEPDGITVDPPIAKGRRLDVTFRPAPKPSRAPKPTTRDPGARR